MRAVLQRVTQARVDIAGKTVGQIDQGFLVLLGVCAQDYAQDMEILAKKTAELRVFADENGKMNRSLLDIEGQVLVVSQFTLYADTSHGRRPSFLEAAPPDQAIPLYEGFCTCLQEKGIVVRKGIFGADMQVSLCNDGPVTIILDTAQWRKKVEN